MRQRYCLHTGVLATALFTTTLVGCGDSGAETDVAPPSVATLPGQAAPDQSTSSNTETVGSPHNQRVRGVEPPSVESNPTGGTNASASIDAQVSSEPATSTPSPTPPAGPAPTISTTPDNPPASTASESAPSSSTPQRPRPSGSGATFMGMDMFAEDDPNAVFPDPSLHNPDNLADPDNPLPEHPTTDHTAGSFDPAPAPPQPAFTYQLALDTTSPDANRENWIWSGDWTFTDNTATNDQWHDTTTVTPNVQLSGDFSVDLVAEFGPSYRGARLPKLTIAGRDIDLLYTWQPGAVHFRVTRTGTQLTWVNLDRPDRQPQTATVDGDQPVTVDLTFHARTVNIQQFTLAAELGSPR